jgi:phosphotriesterase-related protein
MKLIQTGFLALVFLSSCSSEPAVNIMTVTGQVTKPVSGLWLPHEHILVDFIGADSIAPGRYDRGDAFRKALPFVKQAYSNGVRYFAECTPEYLGRDPLLLKMLSDSSGMIFLTNTGFYGARNNKFIPAQVLSMNPDQLAAIWTAEWENGIGTTGIKPGFIKIAVERAPLSEFHKTLARAAARTHLKTGLTIASHTGPSEPALAQIEILKEEGVSPEAFIWVHAHEEKAVEKLVAAAEQGAWLSFDKLDDRNAGEIASLVVALKQKGYLNRILVSHDAGWFDPAKEKGGEFRGFSSLTEKLIPELENRGFTQKDIDLLVTQNPAKAYSIIVRKYSE